MKWNGSHTQKFTNHPRKYLTACIFSMFYLVLWLAPSLGTVSEVKLMLFCVYFLLWQLLSCVVLASHLTACWHLAPVSSLFSDKMLETWRWNFFLWSNCNCEVVIGKAGQPVRVRSTHNILSWFQLELQDQLICSQALLFMTATHVVKHCGIDQYSFTKIDFTITVSCHLFESNHH